MRKEKRETKGYRNRYDIIDHGHKKNTFMYFFKDLFRNVLPFNLQCVLTFFKVNSLATKIFQ